MLLTLEALQADKGDSLILEYGDAAKPRIIVIDGGPKDVFHKSLEPRLNALKGNQARLPIDMVMVSHIDDDHVRGVLDLFQRLVNLDQDRMPLPYGIGTLWHNSFDDIVGNRSEELFSHVAAAGGAAAASAPAAIIASVAQGRQLRQLAGRLKVKFNEGFDGLVMAPATGRTIINRPGGLTLTVLSPPQKRVEKLHAEWEAQVQSHGWREAVAAAFTDQSIYNLSSIVVLAELESKRILLTGDARGDDILSGLEGAGLLQNGSMHLDIFKLPHHGSSRNASVDFFKRLTADRYVISANGENGNPDPETLAMIAEARGSDAYTVYMTNRECEDWLAAHPAPHREVIFRPADAIGLKIDLLDKSL